MGKFYLMMNQGIPVYFMINPDLVGNGQVLDYEKRNAFFLFYVYFWVHVGLCLIMELEGYLFSHFSFSVFHQTGKHLYYFYHFVILFFFKYMIFFHKSFYINFTKKLWLLIIIGIQKLMNSIKFHLISNNVKGLQSYKKLLKIFEYLKKKRSRCHFIFARNTFHERKWN